MAVRDIREAVSCVSEWEAAPVAGERLGARLVEAAESLAILPQRRPVYRSLRPLEHETRWLLVDHWYLFYWVDEGERKVTIARVVYAWRDLSSFDAADVFPHLG